MQASEHRFSVARLFYFLTLCAAATSLFGWLGVPVGCFVMLIWIQVLAAARREQNQAAHSLGIPSKDTNQAALLPRFSNSHVYPNHIGASRGAVTKLELVVVLMIATLVVGLMIPAGQDFDPQQQAETSMKMVAKAVDAYQQHFGVRPPSVIVSQDGTPLHSWRALILPFLGEEKLADAYRWDEPWDGPNNQQLAQYRPWHYRTYYPETESQRTTTSLQLLAGTDESCYVVEHEQTTCLWLEPTELDEWLAFNAVADAEQGFWQHGFFSSLYRGRLAVAGQQSLRIHPHQTMDSSIEERLAVQSFGAEKPKPERIEIGRPYRQLHVDNALRLAIFLVIALYPLRWLGQNSR